jgi:predicted choloylglycine hydrolase
MLPLGKGLLVRVAQIYDIYQAFASMMNKKMNKIKIHHKQASCKILLNRNIQHLFGIKTNCNFPCLPV